MISRQQIEELIAQGTHDSDVFVVDIQIKPGNRIQVFLDEPAGISIDTCVAFSRLIESGLDRDTEDFELQVSSPGLDQPLKVPRQYQKYIGERIQTITASGEKFRGVLTRADDQGFDMEAVIKVKTADKKKREEMVLKTFLYRDIKSVKVDLVF